MYNVFDRFKDVVSTHSRPKAAGFVLYESKNMVNGFNTQPPEGGWLVLCFHHKHIHSFNTQPPEGGWDLSATLPMA